MSRAEEQVVVSSHDAGQGTLRSYTTGFLLSLVFTLIAYGVVDRHAAHHVFSHALVMVVIFCLAIIQLFVQLVCFLHLGRESKPRWNLTVLAFAIMVVVIVVGGSLWIMNNLNYRMTPSQVNNYMNSQDGF